LEKNGYVVCSASNGDEALEKVESEKPNLILLDVVMPGKTGLEVCKILKSQPKTRSIPAVMFTALEREIDKEYARQAGADGFLGKPFTMDDLASAVHKFLAAAKTDKFSRALGLDHPRLIGRKILMEFDPIAPCERYARDLVVEAQANGEAVIVVAPESGVVHQALRDEVNIKFVSPTERYLATVLQAHAEKPFTLIYDSLTELILSQGMQFTYGFTRNTLESLVKHKRSTALFLLNPDAHKPEDVSSIRSLFSNIVACGKDGLTKVRLT